MKQVVVQRLSPDSMRFICREKFDNILRNENKLSKGEIVDEIRNLRDYMDRFF